MSKKKAIIPIMNAATSTCWMNCHMWCRSCTCHDCMMLGRRWALTPVEAAVAAAVEAGTERLLLAAKLSLLLGL
jgi:hypothetical protein